VTTAAATLPDNPSDPKPKIEDYDTYEAGIEALSRWNARQEYAQLRAQEAQASAQAAAKQEHQKRLETYFARLDEFKQSAPDFDQMVNRSDVNLPVSPAVSSLIVESPVGPAISYYLAQHPDECQALYALDERSAAKALGRIEAKLDAPATPAPVVPAKAAPPQPVSHAPAPITPVRGAAVSLPTDDGSYRDYRKLRLAGKV
jgi:hypothetical protein